MWPMVAMAGAQLVGGLLANDQMSNAQAAAQEQYEALAREINALPIPDVEKQRLYLETIQSQGEFNPELLQAETLAPSAVQGMSADPRLKQAQMMALQEMQRMGQSGLSEQDRLALAEAREGAASQEKSRQASLLQELASRGAAGSGQELALRQMSSQSSANELARQADRQAAMQQEARRQALLQAGNMAGTMSQQDLAVQESRARAKDAIEQFNLRNRADVQAANTQAMNQAALRSLQEKQRIAESNTALRNTQQQYNKELNRQKFLDEMAKLQLKSGNTSNIAQSLADQARTRGQMFGGIMQGIGTIGAGMMSASGKAEDTADTSGDDTPNWAKATKFGSFAQK